MHVFITTVGSRGDVQPYLALGHGLQAAGHRVTINTAERFAESVRSHGINYAPLADDFIALLDTQAGLLEDMGDWRTAVPTAIRTARATTGIQRDLVFDGWEAARAAAPDLVLFHPKMAAATHYAEALGVPAVLGTPLPQFVSTAAFPAVGFPPLPSATYTRATYRLVETIASRLLASHVRALRASLGLPRWRGADLLRTRAGEPVPVLHAISHHVVPEPADWPATASMTGYWFLDGPNWTPPPALKAFLASGPPPVYVGFGSMSGRHPERLTALIVDALDQAGVRGLLASGWGGLAPGDLPSTVHAIEAAPHDALFPRVAAVVHHGGAGTTAAGLRAGRPTVICPFFGDQPFWGRRVEALGVGPAPVPQKRLTAERLAEALKTTIGNDSLRHRADVLGAAIRAEDGVGTAVHALEAIHEAA